MNDSNNGNEKRCSLFIGDLSYFCEEADIIRGFEPFGEIMEVKIKRNQETNRNLSYGFLRYANSNSAKRAIEEMNGMLLCGRPVRIRWASYKNNKFSGENNNDKKDDVNTAPVHISFISHQINRIVTEESLRSLFEKYGEIVDTTINKFTLDEAAKKQSGYGFVHFPKTLEGIQAALNVTTKNKEISIDNVNYKCNASHHLSKQLKQLQEMSDVPVDIANLSISTDRIPSHQKVNVSEDSEKDNQSPQSLITTKSTSSFPSDFIPSLPSPNGNASNRNLQSHHQAGSFATEDNIGIASIRSVSNDSTASKKSYNNMKNNVPYNPHISLPLQQQPQQQQMQQQSGFNNFLLPNNQPVHSILNEQQQRLFEQQQIIQMQQHQIQLEKQKQYQLQQQIQQQQQQQQQNMHAQLQGGTYTFQLQQPNSVQHQPQQLYLQPVNVNVPMAVPPSPTMNDSMFPFLDSPLITQNVYGSPPYVTRDLSTMNVGQPLMAMQSNGMNSGYVTAFNYASPISADTAFIHMNQNLMTPNALMLTPNSMANGLPNGGMGQTFATHGYTHLMNVNNNGNHPIHMSNNNMNGSNNMSNNEMQRPTKSIRQKTKLDRIKNL
eukprot:gene11695-15658_t